MGTILDFERIGILLNSFSVISGFCADMLDRNYFGQCIHFGGLYPFCELVHSTAEGYRRCLASDRGGCTSARLCGQDYYVYRCHIGLTEIALFRKAQKRKQARLKPCRAAAQQAAKPSAGKPPRWALCRPA